MSLLHFRGGMFTFSSWFLLCRFEKGCSGSRPVPHNVIEFQESDFASQNANLIQFFMAIHTYFPVCLSVVCNEADDSSSLLLVLLVRVATPFMTRAVCY